MTRFTLILAVALAAVGFSTFATAQNHFQSVVLAPDQHPAQGQNRNDRDSDLVPVSLDASDQVPMRQPKSNASSDWESNVHFDGARLVEAQYTPASACYKRAGSCPLLNVVAQGAACWCYFRRARVISVRQSESLGQIVRPKTSAGHRDFARSPQLAEHLREFLGDKKQGLLFVLQTGRPWRESKVVEKRLNPLLRKLGIKQKGLALNGFRHFNATEMDSKNVPVKTRQTRLGHEDPRMTLGME